MTQWTAVFFSYNFTNPDVEDVYTFTAKDALEAEDEIWEHKRGLAKKITAKRKAEQQGRKTISGYTVTSKDLAFWVYRGAPADVLSHFIKDVEEIQKERALKQPLNYYIKKYVQLSGMSSDDIPDDAGLLSRII